MSEWRRIIGFPDYQINEAGDIRNTVTGSQIRPSSDGKGTVQLYVDRVKKHRTVLGLLNRTFPPGNSQDSHRKLPGSKK